jgi:hypothetical protein
LKRVFAIEIDGCARCGGKLTIIASIEEPAVIARILAHLQRTVPEQHRHSCHSGHAHRPRRHGCFDINDCED